MSDAEARVVSLYDDTPPDVRARRDERELPQEPRDIEAVAILTADALGRIKRIEAGATEWQRHISTAIAHLAYDSERHRMNARRAHITWPWFVGIASFWTGVLSTWTALLITHH